MGKPLRLRSRYRMAWPFQIKHDLVAGPARHGTAELQLMLGLDQFVDQRCRSREAYPALLTAGRNRQSGEQMSLAGAAVAYKDDGLSPCDIAAFGELVNLLRRDLRALREVELLQGLYPRQMRFANAALHQPAFAVLEFSLQQCFEEAEVRPALAHRLFCELGALRGDGRQMQHLALLPDGGRLQNRSLRAHGATSWPSSAS